VGVAGTDLEKAYVLAPGPHPLPDPLLPPMNDKDRLLVPERWLLCGGRRGNVGVAGTDLEKAYVLAGFLKPAKT